MAKTKKLATARKTKTSKKPAKTALVTRASRRRETPVVETPTTVEYPYVPDVEDQIVNNLRVDADGMPEADQEATIREAVEAGFREADARAALQTVVASAPSSSRPPIFRARNVTEAQKRGAELVRFLRIHTKHPYGHRGQSAIYALACEVGHLGLVQLSGAN
jgi:hypothetical protein